MRDSEEKVRMIVQEEKGWRKVGSGWADERVEDTEREQRQADCQIVRRRCEVKKLWEHDHTIPKSPAIQAILEASSSDGRCDCGLRVTQLQCLAGPLCWRAAPVAPSQDDMANRSRDFLTGEFCDFGLTCGGKTSDCEVYECNAFLQNRRESTETIRESPAFEDLRHRSKAPSPDHRCGYAGFYGRCAHPLCIQCMPHSEPRQESTKTVSNFPAHEDPTRSRKHLCLPTVAME